ncbi:MAG: zinc-binding dehydrogenase [Desulfurococcales archaeon]|nr:zinc-binding dehydrogenase [Desulfurococcales archaeon]
MAAVEAKAAVLRGFREPFEIERLRLEPPDPSWKLVDVKAVGVCGRDVVVWKGGFTNLKPPLILGHEVFGEHEGRPVGVYPGVVGPECMTPDGSFSVASCTSYTILGEEVPGGYSTKLWAPGWNLVPLPDEEYAKYAAATCGVATYIHASKVAGLVAGMRVLVVGASGGVGVHGVQYLKMLGAEVLGYTRSPMKGEVLRRLGVEPVLDPLGYRRLGRVDVVLENVGASTINWSMRWLKPGGTLVLIGNVEGAPITLERPAYVVMRELRIVGSAAYDKREYTEALKLIGEGAVKPLYRSYPLDRINEAYSDVASGRLVGRAVLTVGG